MESRADKSVLELILLGNSLVTRFRRQLRRVEPGGTNMQSMAKVVRTLDQLGQALKELESGEKPGLRKRHRGRQMAAISAGFHAALENLSSDGPLAESPADGAACVDEAEDLGYRGGPFKVADVLVHLGLLQRSGALTIRGPQETVCVEMVEGDVVNAFSDQTPPGMRLGEILVAQGAVSQEHLDAFVERHRCDPCRMGKALQSEKLVTGEQLAAALRFQFQQLFTRCLTQRDATVSFQIGGSLNASHEVRLDVVGLLLEGLPNTRTGEIRILDSEAVPPEALDLECDPDAETIQTKLTKVPSPDAG